MGRIGFWPRLPPQTDPVPRPRTLTCIGCRQEVAVLATTMTGDGPVCDP